MCEKVQGIRSVSGRYRKRYRQGEVKNSMGNGEAKELICMTHEHELRGVEGMLVVGEYRAQGNKGGKQIGTTVIA